MTLSKSTRPLPKSKRIGLRSKQEGKCAWHRLPFVGKDHGLESFWDVPMTGGYFGGIEVGRSVACIFLKYVRDQRDNQTHNASGLLRSVLAAMDAKQPLTEEQAESLKGQRTGFMNEICTWLRSAVERLGSSFDAIPERSLVQQANEHLIRTDAAFNAAINAGGSQ
jgi:hypothetical protein